MSLRLKALNNKRLQFKIKDTKLKQSNMINSTNSSKCLVKVQQVNDAKIK